MTMQPPVVIGDAASLARNIVGSDLAIGWKVTGLPADAVSLDTWQDLFEIRLRAILTAIIQTDAPTGLTLDSFGLVNETTIRLQYTLAGHTAHLDLPLAALFATDPPANIGLSANDGDSPNFPHGNHIHRLPTRAQTGETPIVGLDHLATAPVGGRGRLLGYDATGLPEYRDAGSAGVSLGTDDPVPVGGPGTPTPGAGSTSAHDDHGHGIAARSVGLAELKAAALPVDYGKVIGYDETTGEPAAVDAGGGTFLSQTDTPGAFGTEGQVPQVNTALDGLVFGGPFQPLVAPAPPTSLRLTDAFDMSLENHWDASPDAVTYEWQRKVSSAAWPTEAGTSTTDLMVRGTGLTGASYDFRVRSVGHGGVFASAWVELADIPVIATPSPAESTVNTLSRLRSQALHFAWENLDVSNGGVGDTEVVKAATYDYQYREAGTGDWGSLVAHNDTTSVQIAGLTNGTMYEMRVMGTVERSDQTRTEVNGPWSAPSNQEKPVKTSVTLTYGVSDTRTGAITSPRTVEVPLGGGVSFEITNAANPVTDGQFYVLDLGRGDEYSQSYNVGALETRPLPTDITAGAAYMAESEPTPGTDPRRYSVGPATANTQTQIWYIEVV